MSHEQKSDCDLVGRIKDAWGSPEMTPVRAAEFDAELRDRADRPRRKWVLGAGVGMAAATAIALLVALPSTPSAEIDWLTPISEAQVVLDGADEETSAATWMDWVEGLDPKQDETMDYLAAEYLAIGDWFALARTDEKETAAP